VAGGMQVRSARRASWGDLTTLPWRWRAEAWSSGTTNDKPVARVRRYGYILEWFIGDHEPRHVHV